MKIKLTLILSLLCISTLANAIPPQGGIRDEQIAANVAYKNCGAYLYNQDNIVSLDAYKTATEDVQNKMLEAEFYNKRRVCFGKELGKSVATLAPALLVFYKFYAKIGGNGLNGNAAIGIGGTLMFYQIFNSLIGDFITYMTGRIETIKSLVTNVMMPTNNDHIEKIELRYVKEKRFLQEEFRDIIEQTLISARSKKDPYEMGSHSMGGEGSARDKTPIKFIETLLDLPTKNKEVVYDPARIEKYLGTYAPEIAEQFDLFAVRLAAASQSKTVKKMVVYLKGPPGVGKTRAAKNLADAMESPFWVIKLGGKSVRDLEGDATHPGLLLEAIMKAKWEGKNALNPVILFDEIDRALGMTPKKGASFFQGGMDSAMNMLGAGGAGSFGDSSSASTMLPFLLTVLEPGQEKFYFPFLGAELDISNLGIVLAGNFDLTDEAFRNRCEIVELPAYTPEFKWNVVNTTIFDELMVQPAQSKMPITRGDFSEDDWKYIKDVVLSDEDPGFRTVLTDLQNIMAAKQLCKYYNKCKRKPIRQPKKVVAKPVVRFDAFDEGFVALPEQDDLSPFVGPMPFVAPLVGDENKSNALAE